MLRFFPQKDKYVKEETEYELDPALPVPQHIAIIMDGNGRWAQNRRLPRDGDSEDDHDPCLAAWSQSLDIVRILNGKLETTK